MYRGRPEDPARQEAADADANQIIAATWPTKEQQAAADTAADENIGSYPSEEEGEGESVGEAPSEPEPEPPPEP